MRESIKDEERVRIARHLLLSSPPGQFELILSDLQNLVPGSVLDPELISKIRSEYDSRSGRSVLNATPEQEQTDLQTSLEQYLQKHYSAKGVSSKICVTCTQPQTEYEISLYAERVNLKNYNAGSWTGRFVLHRRDTASVRSDATLSGTVCLRAHTFENGNVQMDSTRTLPPATIRCGSCSEEASWLRSISKAVVAQIEKWDEEFVLRPIHHIYDGITDGPLKSLRRVMPVTRTRFDWNLATHRFVKTLSSDVHNK